MTDTKPDIRLRALGQAAREDAQRLLWLARDQGWNVDLVESALGSLATEAHRWKDTWAAVKVQGEREVREASARALECTEHGRLIQELEAQVYHLDASGRSHDRARGSLATGLHGLQEYLKSPHRQADSAPALVKTLAAAVEKVLRSGKL